jgi:hypothetical protein
VRKGKTMGKPKNQGVTQLKFARNLRSVAEERVGKRCGNLRVLNSYWINQVRPHLSCYSTICLRTLRFHSLAVLFVYSSLFHHIVRNIIELTVS